MNRLIASRRAVCIFQASFKNYKICVCTFGNRNDAKICTACSVSIGPIHFVDLMLGWIDGARKTITVAIALNFNTPCWHFVPKRGCWFKVDGVPGELDERVASRICISACYIRAPISNWGCRRSPDTGLFCGNSRRVDVEARNEVSKMVLASQTGEILCSGPCPVIWTRHGERRKVLDVRRNQHGLVTREYGLTERDIAFGFILAPHVSSAIDAIRLVRERLLDISAFVAIQSSVLIQLASICPR